MTLFQSIQQPFPAKVGLTYCDLRKFSYIERHCDAAGVYRHLNQMHEMIAAAVEACGGVNIRYIADNTLAAFEAPALNAVVPAMVQVKADVDALFARQDMPCVLHILLHVNDGNIGMVGGKTDKRLDVSGPVLNELGYYMMKIDTNKHVGLFQGCVLSAAAYDLWEKAEGLQAQSIPVEECEFYLIYDKNEH